MRQIGTMERLKGLARILGLGGARTDGNPSSEFELDDSSLSILEALSTTESIMSSSLQESTGSNGEAFEEHIKELREQGLIGIEYFSDDNKERDRYIVYPTKEGLSLIRKAYRRSLD